MKIQQNQPPDAPKTGSAEKAQQPAEAPPGQAAPKQSVFAGILKKGKTGMGDEAAGCFDPLSASGEKVTSWTGPPVFPGVSKNPDKAFEKVLEKGAQTGQEKPAELAGLAGKSLVGKEPQIVPLAPGEEKNPAFFKGHHKAERGPDGMESKDFPRGAQRHGDAVITRNLAVGAKPLDAKNLDAKPQGGPQKARDFRLSEHDHSTPAVTPQPEPQAVKPLADQPAVHEVHAPAGTAALAQIHALAGEMVDKVQVLKNQAGDERVDIQFNSKTLQGLQVSISQSEGKVSVQFSTPNEQVSQLLSQNVQALTQALNNRGVDVADVRVASYSAAADSGKGGSASDRDSGRGRGGSGGSGRGEQRGGGR
jgi:hypothetical protein